MPKNRGSISNCSKVMTNVKVVQPTNQQINKPTKQSTNKQTGQKQYVPALQPRTRSQVKVRGLIFLYEWEALVTKNLHAKYKGYNWNGSKVMSNVNFFFKVGHRSWSRSEAKFFCMSGKPLSQGTYMSKIKVLSQTVQKLGPMLKLTSQQTNKQTGQKQYVPASLLGT